VKYAIYVSKNGEVSGPFTKKELREAVRAGTVSCDDWAWHKELSEWQPVHAVMPIIHVSRCGEVIAEFDDERDILNGLREGTLLMNDYYWREGMSEWKELFNLPIAKSVLATTAQRDALKAAGLAFKELTTKAEVSALFSAQDDGPAYPKQIALLSYLGIPASKDISKTKASELIDAIVGGSDRREKFGEWDDDKVILFPDVFADEIALRKKQLFSEYSWYRKEFATAGLPKLTLDQANRIFAFLDASKPGWMKPRPAMLLDHFLPCVKAKIYI
jgi:hypothetical protein